MTIKMLDPGVEGDDKSGDFLPDASRTTNDNVRHLDRAAEAALGTLPTPIIAGVGDSNIGHFHNPFASSPWFQTMSQVYNFNAYVPTEWAFSAPGVRSGPLRVTEVARLRDKIASTGIMPILVDVSSGQNDGLVQLDQAQGSFANITGTVQDILDLGVPNVLLWGMLPDPKIYGRGRPEALDWLNTALMNWANDKPRVTFINLLQLVKDQTGAGETQKMVINGSEQTMPAVWWKQGVQANGQSVKTHGSQPGLGAIGSTGIDNEHPAMYFGHLVAPVLGPVLERILGVMPLPDVPWADYDPAYSPLGNYLGTRGLNAGTGGQLLGSPSSDVPASWNVEGDLDKLGSAVITPSIFVDSRGNRRIRLTGSGVPGASGVVKIATRMAYGAPSGQYMLCGRVSRRGMRGFSGFTLAGGGAGLGTAGGLANVLPTEANDDILVRSMSPVGWGNTFNGVEFSWSTAFVEGVELAGTIDFYRTSWTIRS